MNLSFDPSATWDAGDPFDGDFQPNGGKKWHVNGEQRITSWVDDEEAKKVLSGYVGTYNLKATRDWDDELGCWDLEGVAADSDLKLVVDAEGMAHLTGTLDGASIDQVSYMYGGGEWEIWLDYAFVHKGKSIYFELHLAPVAWYEIYSGWCGYMLFR